MAVFRILARFRATGRLALFAGTVLAALVAFVIRARFRRDLGGRAQWLQWGCRWALRALGVRCRCSGRPARNVIIAANHLGYLDILVLAAMTPTVFVAKREVRAWPIFGWLARLAGTRFIDREKRADVVRVADELAAPLAAGVSVVVFLEGTSSNGQKVLPFKSSLLEPAVRHQWPVKPAALSYLVPRGHAAGEEVCWWGDMTLASHLFNLAGLPWIEARVAWGAKVEAGGDRKQFAVELHRHVVQLHRTGSTGVPPAIARCGRDARAPRIFPNGAGNNACPR
jgi:1-acyl-sn-glycerol-3-phosphate acyltransferase